MRKSVTKTIKATVAFAMAIGAGVGAAMSGPKANPVVAATNSTQYSLINSVGDLEAGKSYIITNGTTGTVKTMSSSSNTNNRPTVDATITDGKITRGSTILSVTLGGSSGAWTFHTDNYGGTAGYFGQGNQTSNNYLKIYNAVGSGAAGDTWTISFSGSAAVITSTKQTSRNIIRCNTSGTPITCYSSGQNAVYLFKEIPSSLLETTTTITAENNKNELTASLNPADTVQLNVSVTYNSGQSNILNPVVEWTSNNNNVATVNSSGLVTAVAKGFAKLTATYNGDSTYAGSEASIYISVFDSNEAIFNFANLAVKNSWVNGNDYTPVVVYGTTLSTTSGGNNAKYYSSDNSWRMYSGGSLTITPPSGKSISAVSSTPSHSFSIANDGSNATASFNATVQFTSITVTLAPIKVLDSISASVTNLSRVWRVNDEVFASDLTIIPHYTDGSDGVAITNGDGVTVTNGTITIAGNNTVNVFYGNKSTTVTISALSSTVVDWTITGSVGETVKSTAYNLDNLTIHAWYDNGQTDEASSSVANLYEMVANPLIADSTPNPDNVISIEIYLKTDTEHENCLKTISSISAPIINAPKGSVDNPYTVGEAINAIETSTGTTGVYVKGVVSGIVTPYDSNYGNISYNISSDGSTLSEQLEAFRGKSFDGDDFVSENDIEFGANVVVCGNLIKHGSTYELDAGNQLISYETPTDEMKAKAYLASSSSYTKIIGEEDRDSGFGSEVIEFGKLGLENGIQYSEPFDGGHFTVTFGGGANDGKYYTDGASIRTYGGGTITIASESTIKRVEFTWANDSDKPQAASVANTGTYDVSSSNWIGSANSIVIKRPSGGGHWKLQSIRVACGNYVGVNSIALRFGVSILASSWDAVNNNSNLNITDYGVMFFRTTEAYRYSAPSVESLYRANASNVAISRKNSAVKPTEENGYYSFTARVNITSSSNYDIYFCAMAFVVVNGTDYYFVGKELRESVRTIAQANNGTNLSREVLGYLTEN